MVRTLIRLAVLVVLACQPLSLASAQMAAAPGSGRVFPTRGQPALARPRDCRECNFP